MFLKAAFLLHVFANLFFSNATRDLKSYPVNSIPVNLISASSMRVGRLKPKNSL